MHSYCSNYAVTVLNAAKSLKIRSAMNFKILKFTCILSASQPASQPAVRPIFTSAMALEFLYSKGNHVGFNETVVPMNIYPLRHGATFYPLLVSFCLQITHRKVRNLQKVLISL